MRSRGEHRGHHLGAVVDESYLGTGRVVRLERARCRDRPLAPPARRRAPDHLRDRIARHGTGPEDLGQRHRTVDDGRFDAHLGCSTVEHAIDVVAEIGPHVSSRRRAHGAEPVRRRRGDASTETSEQFVRNRMRRDAKTHSITPAGHVIGDPRAAQHQQCERAGPEGGGEHSGVVREVTRPVVVEDGGIPEVDDEWMSGRSALHLEHAAHGIGVLGIGAESVHRLGRERDEATASQHVDRERDVSSRGGVGVHRAHRTEGYRRHVPEPVTDRVARRPRAMWLVAALLVLTAFAPTRAIAEVAVDTAKSASEMTPAKAAVLGVVEGVTEFLPISSTGHLLVTQRLMDIGTTDETKDAANAYAIAIQSGAILAVLILYWRRIRSMIDGVIGRDPDGRRTFIGLVLAVAPAALVGLAFEGPIKDNLLEVGPVIAAWIVGGLVILVVAPRLRGSTGGAPLEQITIQQALIIGVVQCLALWPGTSRSLVTILAALAVGLSLSAAVEFSFLLGLVTLGAATVFEVAKDGSTMVDAYGWVDPFIGFAFAFVSAAFAIKWMVGYLQRHSLAIFGWYRLAVAGIALVLVATGAL
jgi:undecaprenyl-diphosphatase